MHEKIRAVLGPSTWIWACHDSFRWCNVGRDRYLRWQTRYTDELIVRKLMQYFVILVLHTRHWKGKLRVRRVATTRYTTSNCALSHFVDQRLIHELIIYLEDHDNYLKPPAPRRVIEAFFGCVFPAKGDVDVLLRRHFALGFAGRCTFAYRGMNINSAGWDGNVEKQEAEGMRERTIIRWDYYRLGCLGVGGTYVLFFSAT
jgi:hypothetical protein